jgi:hypothetical protein
MKWVVNSSKVLLASPFQRREIYYTKAFAGLDPMEGGCPTPIDVKCPYEVAAPFFK